MHLFYFKKYILLQHTITLKYYRFYKIKKQFNHVPIKNSKGHS